MPTKISILGGPASQNVSVEISSKLSILNRFKAANGDVNTLTDYLSQDFR